MTEILKSKSKKILKWTAGLSGAALLGFIQGAGVEKIMAEQVMEALKVGDIGRLVAYALVFFFIWLEVRGMKRELHKLNATVSNSFREGEKRFEVIERTQGSFKSRLDKLEGLLQH